MQSNLFLCAPNLIGDIYRSKTVDATGKFHNSYDFIDINQDGVFVLGTTDVCGRVWSGTLWVFNDLSAVPHLEKCLGYMDFEYGTSAGKWFNNGKNIVVGTDCGSVNILSTTSTLEEKKKYLSLQSTISDHEDGITSMDISFDNKKMVTGSRDMSIKIFDLENEMVEKTFAFAHSQTVNGACFKPGGCKILVSTSDDGDSLIWDTRLEKPALLLLSREAGFTACSWLDDNRVVLGANNGSLYVVNLKKKTHAVEVICTNRPIHYVNFEEGSQLLAVCADDPVVRVYDCSRTKPEQIYECERHADFVRGLCWQPPNRLYSCGFGKSIMYHDITFDREGSTTNSEMEENVKPHSPDKEE